MGSNERKRRKFFRQLTYILISAAIFAGILLYARNIEQRSTYFFVKFNNPDGSISREFKLEIAHTTAARSKGLMYRKELPSNGGMVFVYPREEIQSFWMKNTYVPLDMIFLDRNWRVLGVLHEVPINNTEARKIDKPSMYVVEIPAGTAEEDGIQEGSTAAFNIPPPIAEN